jgi:hypothetical protein
MGLMTDKPSNDDIIDERIRALATGQFNAPGAEPPREAMWDAIASARRAARAPTAAATHPASTPITSRRITQRTAWRWSAVLAAGLILGVAVDRTVNTTNGRAPDTTALAHSDPRSAVPVDSLQQAFYRSAATQTLVQAEALLTSYRSSENKPRDPQTMQQAARWARDVLSSTRLLMDSPAGHDPQMRALFSDLELILAQLVQISGAPLQADERELIERSMHEHNLLPRLRSAVPSGLAAS